MIISGHKVEVRFPWNQTRLYKLSQNEARRSPTGTTLSWNRINFLLFFMGNLVLWAPYNAYLANRASCTRKITPQCHKLGRGGESCQVRRARKPPFLKCVGRATFNYSNLPRTQTRIALEKYQHDCLVFFCVINAWSFWLCFWKLVWRVCSHFPNFSFRIFQCNFDTASSSTSRSNPINMKLQTLLLKDWGAQRL